MFSYLVLHKYKINPTMLDTIKYKYLKLKIYEKNLEGLKPHI